MPYKFETDKLKINRPDNKNVKLSESERDEIKRLYGHVSQRQLAKWFNVSRRLIVFIGDHSQYEQNIKRLKERGGSKIYYNKDKHKQYMKSHRQHKKELNEKNKLIKRE